jgi:hypothetical protein
MNILGLLKELKRVLASLAVLASNRRDEAGIMPLAGVARRVATY